MIYSPQRNEVIGFLVLCGHPSNSCNKRVWSNILLTVSRDDVASMRFEDLINFRCLKLGAWLKLASELKLEETKLKAEMSDSRRRILESKGLLLMKQVIASEGYDDVGLADDLIAGFSLVGDVPKSHVLPQKMTPSTLSTSDLKSNANRANKALRFMTRSSGDAELDQTLWDRRFPISQSEKVRPIDDFSQSQINSTVTTYEQATVDGPDVICALAVKLMRCLKDNGRSIVNLWVEHWTWLQPIGNWLWLMILMTLPSCRSSTPTRGKQLYTARWCCLLDR